MFPCFCECSLSDIQCDCFNFSEEHLQKKIDSLVKEAKTKMGKGDKKGKGLKSFIVRTNDSRVSQRRRGDYYRGALCFEKEKAI